VNDLQALLEALQRYRERGRAGSFRLPVAPDHPLQVAIDRLAQQRAARLGDPDDDVKAQAIAMALRSRVKK
jgi:hypothetical protein